MDIAIIGEGIICAIGADKASVLDSLRHRRPGIGEMHHLHSCHTELPVGEVPLSNDEMARQLGLEPSDLLSRTALMGMLAVRQALDDAGLTNSRNDVMRNEKLEMRNDDYSQGGKDSASKGNHHSSFLIPHSSFHISPSSMSLTSPLRLVLISGTTVAGMDVTERFFSEMQHSDDHLSCLLTHNAGSNTQQIADYFGCFADCTTISTACSSAANAIILGARLLEAGQADIVVAGGTEALSAFHLNGFRSLMILDEQPCRPFDATRAGLNLGEGAAYLVMERAERAQQRKADVHGWLTGWGNACDAFHQTATSANGEGAYLAMTDALAMAGLQPQDIQYVNAHGTGTLNNDLSESVALSRVFGQAMPMVSSTKSFTGHTTSASGSIEAVICLLALRHQFVPANRGFSHPMPDGITPTLGSDSVPLRHVLSNAFAFGGNDSALVFSRDYPGNDVMRNEKLEMRNDGSSSPIKILSRVEITSDDDLAEIRQYIKPLDARRMGHLMKASLLSSLKALEAAGISRPDAIITATALGCVESSEQLLRQIEQEGEVMLKPTNFMQSTHNTISSNIAIHTRCHGYNITYSQQEHSLEWALRDAELLLSSGRCKTVLVGWHDETTPLYRSLIERLFPHSSFPLFTSHLSLVLSCSD